jgi:chemotaxis protein methyltransferase CheR
MNSNQQVSENFIKMTLKDFNRLGDFIYINYGIRMPQEKHVMLQSRLQKRLKELKMTNFTDYVDYVLSSEGQNSSELIEMVNQVSTNKTDFFRESQHFDFLVQEVLPEYTTTRGLKRMIEIWSSASSTGEEPYTLAMVMANWCSKNPGFDFSIFGTDISTKVLQNCLDATYHIDKIQPIPLEFKRKYLLKHKDPTVKTVRIIPELRNKCSFSRLNLMDPYYNIDKMFDIVFCRNVLIYFDKDTQEKVINKLCMKLRPGGYFFLGHSESIMNINVPLRQIKPTIFVKI